jgi:hypothetical protein
MKLQLRMPKARARRARPRLDVPSAVVGALGGGVAYVLGRRARQSAGGRGAAALRHVRKRLARGLRVRAAYARGHAHGLAHRLRRAPVPELDDATLAHKVESVLFRDRHVPKGRISVNAERGAVFLRGELESQDLIQELEQAVRAIAGIRSVENLLHVPGTPAPHPRGGTLLRH